jgi:hypothetical protein
MGERLLRIRRTALALGVASMLSPGTRVAHAADATKLQCIEAHEQAQVTRHDGHLRASRRNLGLCTRPACPSVVQKECGAWLEQLNAAQPTVVFAVRDGRGLDATDVRVILDGELLVDHLDGRPLEVDPGEHTFRFELAGGGAVEQRLVLREGELGRAVAVSLAPAPPRAPPAPAPLVPSEAPRPSAGNTAGFAIAGILGLAALGAGVAFTVLQNDQASSAATLCGNGCVAGSMAASEATSDVGSAKTDRVLEGASFGAAGVALGVSAYFLFARPLRVSVDVSSHGATLGWRASF